MAQQKPRIERRPLDGVLLLDKPCGMTSNTALQRARWMFRAQKGGHTGVLDPLATGLLPLCFGEATKFSAFLLDADKGYRATLRFGAVSSTLDREGEITPVASPAFDREQLEAVIRDFMGVIDQVPPMYSALKFQGKALYEYARAGVEIERKVRQVTIHRIDLLAFDGETAVMDVACSKGTYIRTLAADIGERLGCGAYLTDLRRTTTAGFRLEQTVTLEQLEALDESGRDGLLLPADILVSHLPRVVVDEADFHRMTHGQPAAVDPEKAVQRDEKAATISRLRLYAEDGRFFGLGEIRADGRLWPDRMLAKAREG